MKEDDADRALGPEMKAEGWLVVGGDDILWLHSPSHRCLSVSGPCTRESCQVPCWGQEPEDRQAMGYFVACRVHDDLGNPLYGDAFWTSSYGQALRLARRIRADILAETPAHGRLRKREYKRRHDEVWRELRKWAANNARIRA